jgi:hypothetical protein
MNLIFYCWSMKYIQNYFPGVERHAGTLINYAFPGGRGQFRSFTTPLSQNPRPSTVGGGGGGDLHWLVHYIRQQTRIFITGYKKVWNEYCYKCIDVFIAKASTMALYGRTILPLCYLYLCYYRLVNSVRTNPEYTCCWIPWLHKNEDTCFS